MVGVVEVRVMADVDAVKEAIVMLKAEFAIVIKPLRVEREAVVVETLASIIITRSPKLCAYGCL